jgi:lysophospholipase L1-like esterase
MIKWHDIQDWGVEGKGWDDTVKYFDRLPAKSEKSVPEGVWNLSRSATGMAALFETNAPEIHARWKLSSEQVGELNFPAAGFSGVDLYTDFGGKWRWVGAGHQVKNRNPEQCLINGMKSARRRFILYLPLRNPVEKVEIGVPDESKFKTVSPRPEKPLVFYGTSIVHGAYASHSGMVHPSILGRWLDRPVINLGFSGQARMESSLADLVAELEAEIFILDALPNMDLTMVRERTEPFVRILRKAHPATPIVMVEDRPLTNAWIKPAQLAEHKEKWSAYNKVYEKLKKSGMKNLYYIKGLNLFGNDSEGSLDSSHSSDLGYMRMAESLYPLLSRLCKGK